MRDDFKDSFNPRALRREYPLVLFGNRNIGAESRCNAQVGGQTFGDQRLVVQSWRARTNIDVSAVADAWRGWTHAYPVDAQ